MKKKLFLVATMMTMLVAVALASTSCKAQRVITAQGVTVVKNGDSEKADSVRCAFELKESYVGVQRKSGK